MKKYKRFLLRGISFFVTLLLVFQLTACENEDVTISKEDEKMKGTLSVYYVDYERSIENMGHPYAYTMLIDELINDYPDLKIEATVFPTQEAFMTQVSTELASGKGPDIFLLDFKTKLNANKMVVNGVYENIAPYMKNDKSFDINNYYQPAIKAGEFDGKQYIMPLGMSFTNLYTTKEKLKDNGISFDGNYTYKDVLSALYQSIEKAEKNKEVIPIALNTMGDNYLTILLSAFGIPLVDYDKKQMLPEKEIVLEVCDLLKKFSPFKANAKREEYLSESENYSKIEYYLCNYGYPTGRGHNTLMMQQIDQKSTAILMPKYDNPSENVATISYFATMNSNSKNKQLAYDTIVAMTEIARDGNIDWDWPVNRNAMDEWINNKIVGMPWGIYIDGNDMVITHTEEYAEELKATIDDIQYVVLNNVDVMGIVEEGFQPYIEGDTKTFDECYEETVNKLKLYINE